VGEISIIKVRISMHNAINQEYCQVCRRL